MGGDVSGQLTRLGGKVTGGRARLWRVKRNACGAVLRGAAVK